MPGAHSERNVLHHLTVSPDKHMTGNPQVRNAGEIRMGIRIEPVGKQVIDPWTAVLARRQTDAMDDNQRDIVAVRSLIAIR